MHVHDSMPSSPYCLVFPSVSVSRLLALSFFDRRAGASARAHLVVCLKKEAAVGVGEGIGPARPKDQRRPAGPYAGVHVDDRILEAVERRIEAGTGNAEETRGRALAVKDAHQHARRHGARTPALAMDAEEEGGKKRNRSPRPRCLPRQQARLGTSARQARRSKGRAVCRPQRSLCRARSVAMASPFLFRARRHRTDQ